MTNSLLSPPLSTAAYLACSGFSAPSGDDDNGQGKEQSNRKGDHRYRRSNASVPPGKLDQKYRQGLKTGARYQSGQRIFRKNV